MKIMAIYGNPKHGGFVHDCLDVVAERTKNVEPSHYDEDGTRFRAILV